ncbi:MAG: hypothetical protein RLN85_20890, partial [Pseudomonadales bacterium]
LLFQVAVGWVRTRASMRNASIGGNQDPVLVRFRDMSLRAGLEMNHVRAVFEIVWSAIVWPALAW